MLPCKYCGHHKPAAGWPEGSWWKHEEACTDNPENLPKVAVMYACGHPGERKRFPQDPDGAKARAFEADRPCSTCWIEEYRRAMENRTAEQILAQRAEARAAHGPGVTLTNVVTGETYTT